MRKAPGPRFDVATVLDRGARSHQQDALVANFPEGEEIGIGVLADGMGGHSGGDVASALVVGRAFAELRAGLATDGVGPTGIEGLLHEALDVANEAVRARIASDPSVRGMGSTLIACVARGPDLHWISVGDSPLYLYREGTLSQVNEDHSMAPRIEAMVASGLMDAELGANHPERNQLLSAICGGKIDHVDCRAEPFALRTGDVLIAASDGLQTLSDAEICRIVHRHRRGPSDDIAQPLMRAVKDAGVPDQDNTAIMVVKVLSDRPLAGPEPAPAAAPAAHLDLDPVALAALNDVAASPSPAHAPPTRPAPAPAPPAAPQAADGPDVERASDDLERALAL